MNRQERAKLAALSIAPAVIDGVVLVHCNLAQIAYAVLIVTAIAFGIWVFGGNR